MNYTEKQIKLAGLIQPESGARELEQALDFQGEGIRVLGSSPVVEENTGDCCDDLLTCEAAASVCEAEKGDLEDEITDLEQEIADLEDQLDKIQPEGTFSYNVTNSSRSGSWRDYNQQYGSLIILPSYNEANGSGDYVITWDTTGAFSQLYREHVTTGEIEYPGGIIATPTIGIRNSSNTGWATKITMSTTAKTYNVVVDFAGNLGTSYPLPDLYPVGSFVSQIIDGVPTITYT